MVLCPGLRASIVERWLRRINDVLTIPAGIAGIYICNRSFQQADWQHSPLIAKLSISVLATFLLYTLANFIWTKALATLEWFDRRSRLRHRIRTFGPPYLLGDPDSCSNRSSVASVPKKARKHPAN